MKSKIETDYNWGSLNLFAWKKGRHLAMPPLISPQKKKRLRDERRDDVLMTCYYLDLGSASNWLKQFFFYQLSQTHMLLVIINYCFVSRIPCSFLFLLVPLVPPLSPCSPLFFCSPCSPLFPFVPLFPLFPLFPLSPPLSSCSAFFPLFPLVLVCSLIPSCAPCSPVSLVRLQFTTLNVWQSQISVNKKTDHHLGETPLKAGYRVINTLPKRFFTWSSEDS